MSEYQHYLFDTVNRMLSADSRKAVSTLSSHISVSRTSASVEYHYSDFKHDPLEVLERYFDVFTYEANWGDQRLAFRFDSETVDTEALSALCVGDFITVGSRGASVIVDCWLSENFVEPCYFGDDEDYYEDRLISTSPYAAFHSEIVEGDLRSIFLIWLRLVEMECVENSVAVPIPFGLNKLKEAHRILIRFIGLSDSLLEVSCKYSKELPGRRITASAVAEHLPKLTFEEKDDFLRSLLEEDPVSVRSKLRKQLAGYAPSQNTNTSSGSSITIEAGRLLTEAEELRQEKALKVKQAKEARRLEYLKTLKKYEERMWDVVPLMIEEKKTKSYYNAALTLQSLKYLADHEGASESYFQRASSIVERYPRLIGMRNRIEAIGLIHHDKHSKSVRREWEVERWMKENPPEKEYPFALLLG